VLDAAARLRAAGHDVVVVDQYDGLVLDSQADAAAHVDLVGFPALMTRALDAVADLDDGFAVAGFSNGAGMATYVATQRRVSAAVLMSGAIPLAMLGVQEWPASVAVQLHYGATDPMRHEEWIAEFTHSVRDSGAPLELHLDYPCGGHLFTDPSLREEYDAACADALHDRLLTFLGAHAASSQQ
jgi:dienelactone hydrolase